MKIALFDNTCNTGYVLMRYLRDAGYDADLFLTGPPEMHADPEADTYTRQYFPHIHTVPWAGVNLHYVRREEIARTFEHYQFVLGSDIAPALFYRARRMLDVFMPHGSDLFEYPFPLFDPQKPRLYPGDLLRGYWQRRGIARHTRRVLFELTNDENEVYFSRLPASSFERVFQTMPLVYRPAGGLSMPPHAVPASVKRMQALKGEGKTVVFHHCQQSWTCAAEALFNKGNDALIRAVNVYRRTHADNRLVVVMVERGPDVAASKKLIADLQLEDFFVWLPMMSRKEIMACLAYADLGVGELGHSWYSYNVVTEFLVNGVPVLHHCDQAAYSRIHAELYPMISVRTADEIAAVLSEFVQDPTRLRVLGASGLEWWERVVRKPGLDLLCGWIEDKRRYG